MSRDAAEVRPRCGRDAAEMSLDMGTRRRSQQTPVNRRSSSTLAAAAAWSAVVFPLWTASLHGCRCEQERAWY